eukprot:scaffold6828_cov66-Phaeocystis_antarctica.AAC.1
MHRGGRSRSRSRDRDRRDGMDRGLRHDDRSRGPHDEDRYCRRPDAANDRTPDRSQREVRGRRDIGGWAWGPRSGTDEGRSHGGAPRPSDGRMVETRYNSQEFHYQPRSEAMGVRNSGARHDGPSLRRDEPARQYNKPRERRDEPQRRYDEPLRRRDEPRRQYESSGHRSEPSHYEQRDGTLYDSGSRTQKRKLPEAAASVAPTWRVGTQSSSQALGRAPPAPKGAVELGRMLSGRISKATSTHELLRLSAVHSTSLNHIHVANLWNKLGKQRDAPGQSHKEEVRQLLRRTIELLESCEARNLSNIAHGLAKCRLVGLDIEAGALFTAVAEAAVRSGLCCFKPQELANTAWAFATAGQRAPALLDAIATEAVRSSLREFDPQNLANTAWALAKADHAAPVLLDAIAAAAVLRLRDFNAQELANTAWAFGTAGHKATALLDAIATEAVRSGLRDFNPQNLANTAWAFAKAGRAAPALLDAIATEAVPRLRDFNPQELANTAWAFATAGRAAPALLDAIATKAVPRLREFNPQGLANTAWAFATAGRAAPALLDAIAAAAAPRLRDFNPQDLANTAWAFAKAGRAAPALLDAIAAEAAPRLREFNPQHLANTAWAFAKAGHKATALLHVIVAAAVLRLRDFTSQGLANTAWAFAAADHLAPALFDSHVFVQLCCAAERSFAPEHLSQLHQWQLWQEERGAAWPPLPPELALRCREAFSSEDGVASKLQLEVVASLLALGLAPREEVRTEQGYSLDVVVLHGGREVAIEVDGPSHFCGRTPTGATALKRRQLRAAGWVLLSAPYWQWVALNRNNATEEMYLQKEYLRAALQQLLPGA